MAPLSSGISSDPVTDWATVLSKSKSVHWNGALDFHRPGFHPRDSRCIRLQKSAKISIEDVSSSTNKWNCALIAQILGDNSSLHGVKNFAESKWNDSGLLEVQKLDNELFIFRFQSEESKNQVLEESVVFYGSKFMYLMPWVPNKPIQKLTLETVPIWIKLPGLGLQYFTLQALSKLGSLIGRPLFADKETIDQSRLSYARMCVEIKADDEKLPNVIFFINEFGFEIGQDVEYEWVPPRCSFCKLFGHDTNLCTKNNVPDPDVEGDSLDDGEASSDDEEISDEEISEENEIPLPKKMKVSRNENEACPCGSEKEHNRCCGSVAAGRSACIEIPLPLPLPLPQVDDQVDDQRKKVIEDVDKDRRYAIDAKIVRIMKSRKVLGYQQLVLECMEQLGHIFKPDVKVIKQRIEDLICREYLERDKENPNMFKYLP